MRNFLYALVALLVALLSAPCQPSARAQQQQASGTYQTSANDQPFGTDSYTLTAAPDGTRRAVSDATFAGQKFRATTVYGADNRPVSYLMEVNGARALAVEFTAQGGKVMPEGQPARELKTRADAVLENGTWHHFIFLLAQYDAARGGVQTFKALVPAQALPFDMTVERTGAPAFDVRGRKVQTEHYRVGTSLGLTFDVWADAARTPLVISITAQRLKVVRGGSEDLASVILAAATAAPKGSPDDPFTSEEVTFQNGDVKLAGTLTVPKAGPGPHPAAVLISGSGPQDRDGAALGNIYRKIAERLSAHGVAVLRADDRGTGASGMPTKPGGYRDLVSDTRAAFEYVLKRKEIDPKRVALVGHSEGATTAVLIAADDPRVAAVASLAGISRPIDAVLVEQTLFMTGLGATVDASDRSKMPDLPRRLSELFDEARRKPAGAEPDSLSWFRDHLTTDPLALVRRVRAPLLILNGERDENVMAHHAIALASAAADGGNKSVRLRIFPNLSHLFAPSRLDKSVPADKYMEVSEEFLQTLEAWMTETLRAGSGAGTTQGTSAVK